MAEKINIRNTIDRLEVLKTLIEWDLDIIYQIDIHNAISALEIIDTISIDKEGVVSVDYDMILKYRELIKENE